MIDFKEASVKAGTSAANSLTQHLRGLAAKQGWHPRLANSLSVNFDGKGFKVSYPDEVRDDVHRLEYGTETTRPTAVIRKFKNRQAHIDNTFVSHLNQHMGGKL